MKVLVLLATTLLGATAFASTEVIDLTQNFADHYEEGDGRYYIDVAYEGALPVVRIESTATAECSQGTARQTGNTVRIPVYVFIGDVDGGFNGCIFNITQPTGVTARVHIGISDNQ